MFSRMSQMFSTKKSTAKKPIDSIIRRRFPELDDARSTPKFCSTGPKFNPNSTRAQQFEENMNIAGSLGCGENMYPTHNPKTNEYCCSTTPTSAQSKLDYYNVLMRATINSMSMEKENKFTTQLKKFIQDIILKKKELLRSHPYLNDIYDITDDLIQKRLDTLDEGRFAYENHMKDIGRADQLSAGGTKRRKSFKKSRRRRRR